MFNIGPTELLVILVIALLVFGPSRLPEVGRTIGKGLREFRRASDEIREELKFDLDADEAPRGTPAPSANGSASSSGSGASNGAATLTPGDHDLPPAAGEAR
jgi:sec-independent protein translocase protein TatA